MIKVKILILLIFTSSLIFAHTTKTVNLTIAGTLTSLLTASEKSTITTLTITGSINEEDFFCMREEMPVLANLDIEGATIAAYSGMFYTSPANELPGMAFSFMSTKKYSNLITIKLPVNLTSIGENAFNGCSGLNSVIIPATCTTIKTGAFWECTALQTVIIPPSVTLIEDDAFNGCTSMNSIYVNNSVPVSFASNATTFQGINKSTCVLYVPGNAVSAYQQADKWKEFENIVGFTTGINYDQSSSIKVSYNSNSNYIKISGGVNIHHLAIYNLTGKLIDSFNLKSDLQQIDFSLYPNGIYLLKVLTDQGMKTCRLFAK